MDFLPLDSVQVSRPVTTGVDVAVLHQSWEVTIDTYLPFLMWWCIQDLLWWESLVLMMPSNLGFCCLCSYACLLPSDYLKCLLPSIYLIGACLSKSSSWVRTPQSPAFSVILCLWAPVNLRFWVSKSSGQSCSSEILKYWCDQAPFILGSCCPKILGVLQCLKVVSPLRSMELSGQCS